ncbi:IS1380 family transposase [Thermodesulfobacteriota bacterium]
MLGNAEAEKQAILPDFGRSIFIDFAGAKITSDAGFLLMREIDQRFGIIESGCSRLVDERSDSHRKHTFEQMIRQRVYQMGAGYEDCNDADYLRIDPAMRLALGKGDQFGAIQSVLSRLENDILGTTTGQQSLDTMITGSTDAVLKRKNKKRLILDVDSTQDPVYGSQEHMAYTGHFRKKCFHRLYCFSGDGDGLAAILRPGNVHSANGTLDLIKPIVIRYRKKFKLFWLRGDSAFADPDIYAFCEANRVTYFIRLRENAVLTKLIKPHLKRPVGRPPQSGVQAKYVDLKYQAQSWDKPRRVVAKIEWHLGELFPRYYFIVTSSRLAAGKVVTVYNGRGDVENRIKEGKNTLRWDKTSCHRFAANQARLKMGFIAYNLLHLIRRFYLWGEDRCRSIEWIITRLVKAGARIVYQARYWHVHVASAFSLAHHYRAVLGWKH